MRRFNYHEETFFPCLGPLKPKPVSSFSLSFSRSTLSSTLCSQKSPGVQQASQPSPCLPSPPNLFHYMVISQAITALLIFHHCKFKVDFFSPPSPPFHLHLPLGPPFFAEQWLRKVIRWPTCPKRCWSPQRCGGEYRILLTPFDPLLSQGNRMLVSPSVAVKSQLWSLQPNHFYKDICGMTCLTR